MQDGHPDLWVAAAFCVGYVAVSKAPNFALYLPRHAQPKLSYLIECSWARRRSLLCLRVNQARF